MADAVKGSDERAAILAVRALELVLSGKAEEGSRALREAASLAPGNPSVKAAFEKIRNDDQQHPLRKACGKFIQENDEEAGKDAIRYLNRSAEVPPEVARECTGFVLDGHTCKHALVRDSILAGLLRESSAAKATLAKRLQGGDGGRETTVAFEDIYNIGDGAANGIVAVILDPSAWTTEAIREGGEKDIFQLYLAKLMEVGDDHDGRAIRGISRLLAADAPKLYTLMDEVTVDIILSTLDYRKPTEIRSQGTLAIAKYLEVSESKGQVALTKYVMSKIARQKNEDLVLAFSAAAAVFPIAPAMASSLFMVEGFISSLTPLLEKKVKSEKVEHAALEMLSAACIDSACRESISKHCIGWLRQTMEAGKEGRSGLAAIILAKLSGPSGHSTIKELQGEKNVDDLVLRLQKMLIGDSLVEKQESVEGLAYASVQPNVKAHLVNDKLFLKSLLKELRESRGGSPIVFGCLTVLNNLTRYPPNLSEEQRRMTQLKAYANANSTVSKNPSLPELDKEPVVNARCKAVLDAGAVPALVLVGKILSPASIALLFNVVLSLSWPQPHRGIIAQQGGVRLLLQLYTKITGTDAESARARHTAAHALARILTSVDPSLVFIRSGTPNGSSAVRPLVSLLTEDSLGLRDGPRDLLPTFEALLALTNLSVDMYGDSSGSIGDLIARLVQPPLDDLILHDNLRIRRAATQLVPNLVQHHAGIALFSDESDAAARRLFILLALSGSEDLETRKAAGGSLAILSEYEATTKMILAQDRGMELLVAMLEDTDDDIIYRGLHAVAGATMATGDTGEAVKVKMKEIGLEDKLEAIIKASNSTQNSEMAAKTLSGFNE